MSACNASMTRDEIALLRDFLSNPVRPVPDAVRAAANKARQDLSIANDIGELSVYMKALLHVLREDKEKGKACRH